MGLWARLMAGFSSVLLQLTHQGTLKLKQRETLKCRVSCYFVTLYLGAFGLFKAMLGLS